MLLKNLKTNDSNRYYSIYRPVGLSSIPQIQGNKIVNVYNFDDLTEIEPGLKAYGYVEYEHALPQEEIYNYDLVPADASIKENIAALQGTINDWINYNWVDYGNAKACISLIGKEITGYVYMEAPNHDTIFFDLEEVFQELQSYFGSEWYLVNYKLDPYFMDPNKLFTNGMYETPFTREEGIVFLALYETAQHTLFDREDPDDKFNELWSPDFASHNNFKPSQFLRMLEEDSDFWDEREQLFRTRAKEFEAGVKSIEAKVTK